MLLWGITYEAPSYLTLPPLHARSPLHSPSHLHRLPSLPSLSSFSIFLLSPVHAILSPPPFLFFSALLPHVFILPSFLRSTTGAAFHFSAAELLADVRANFPKWSGDASKANRRQRACRLQRCQTVINFSNIYQQSRRR